MAVARACPACGAPLTVAPISGQRLHCPNCHRALRAKARTPPAAKEGIETRAEPAPPPGQPNKDQTAVKDNSPDCIPLQRPKGPDEPLDTLHRIDRFEIRAVLGQGSFGRVYKAYDPLLDREVALKVPRLGPGQAQQLERFLREARAAARLRHPNIVSVYEVGLAGDEMFIACEYVEGMVLAARIAERRSGARRSAIWMRDLAKALDFAHRRGVIHRDIKPGNILIDTDGKPRLMDFGLAKRLQAADLPTSTSTPGSQDATLTAEGSVLGTPAYMAPEQARGEVRAVGSQSDVYSLGVVLYELLTGKTPYVGTVHEVLLRIGDVKVQPTQLRELDPDIPPELEAICQKAMAKSLAYRYAGALEFADDLNRWLRNESVGALEESSWRRMRRLLAQKRRWVISAGVLASLLLVVGIALLSSARRQKEVDEQRKAEIARIKREQERLQRMNLELNQGRAQEFHRNNQFREEALTLVKAFQLAIDLDDENLQRSVGRDLRQWVQQVKALPDISPQAFDVWHRAVCRLLGSPPVLAAEDPKGTAPANIQGRVRLQGDPQPAPDVQAVRRAWRVRQPLLGADVLGVPLEDEEPASFATFLPDRRTFVTATGDFWRLWDVRTGRPTGVAHLYAPKAFTADGTQVLTMTSPPATFVLQDTLTGKQCGTPFVCPGAAGRVYLSPNGRTVVLIGSGGFANLWDTVKGEKIGSPDHKDWQPTNVSWSSDGNRLLALGIDERRPVNLWQADVGAWFGCETEFIMQHNRSDVVSMSLSPPGGKMLLTVGRNGQARLWTHESGLVQRSKREIGLTLGLRFEPNGEPLSSGDGKSVTTFALFSPDGEKVVTGAGDKVQFWDANTAEALDLPYPHEAVKGAAFNADGTRLLTWSSKEVRLWNMDGRRIGLPIHSHAPITWARLNEDGTTLAVLADGVVRLWPVTVEPLRRSEAVRLWVELSTGMSVDSSARFEPRDDNGGKFESLDEAGRKQRRQRFEELIGFHVYDPAARPAN